MKRLCLLMVLVAALWSCSSDEPDNFSVTGTWYTGFIDSQIEYDYTQYDLANNGLLTQTRYLKTPAMAAESVTGTVGTWALEGRTIRLMYPGLGTDVYEITDRAERSLNLSIGGAGVTWYRSANDLSPEAISGAEAPKQK